MQSMQLQGKLAQTRMIRICRLGEYMLLDDRVRHCHVFWYTINVILYFGIIYVSRNITRMGRKEKDLNSSIEKQLNVV